MKLLKCFLDFVHTFLLTLVTFASQKSSKSSLQNNCKQKYAKQYKNKPSTEKSLLVKKMILHLSYFPANRFVVCVFTESYQRQN